MDAAIADTLNRLTAEKISTHLDLLDAELGYDKVAPWHRSPISETLMGDGPADNADRAWFVGHLAARTPDLSFDGAPADCDWDNLFSHFRTEIVARRDSESPSVRTAETPVRDGVGSR
jgi:hypothetical protein